MPRDLEIVLAHYLACAEWADAPEDEDHNGLSEDFKEQAREDCKDFIALVDREGADSDLWTDERFGHDFWLTRRGHGVGFWDRGHGNIRDLSSPGGKLTELAQTFSSDGLYVGDDGFLYA